MLGEVSGRSSGIRPVFEEALEHYRERRFEKALALLRHIADERPNDLSIFNLRAACETFLRPAACNRLGRP